MHHMLSANAGWRGCVIVRFSSADHGKSWILTDTQDVPGIGHGVPFVDIAQNPLNLDDLVVTGGFGWMPPPGTGNGTTWLGGLRRSLDGGKTFMQVRNDSAVRGFVGASAAAYRAGVSRGDCV